MNFTNIPERILDILKPKLSNCSQKSHHCMAGHVRNNAILCILDRETSPSNAIFGMPTTADLIPPRRRNNFCKYSL